MSVKGESVDIDQQTEELEKQTKLLQAQAARREAEKTLAEAEQPKTAIDTAVDNAKKLGDLADAQKKVLDSVVPKGLEGTTSSDATATFENQILAFNELLNIARQMAEAIAVCVRAESKAAESKAALTLVVQDDGDIAALALYEGALADISLVADAYRELAAPRDKARSTKGVTTEGGALPHRISNDRLVLEGYTTDLCDRVQSRYALGGGLASTLFEPAVGAAIAAGATIATGGAAPIALGAAQAAVALAGLMRTNVQVTGTPITLSETGLLAELAHQLKAKNIGVVSFALFPPKLDLNNSTLVAKLEALEKARDHAAVSVADDKGEGRATRQDQLKTLDSGLAALHADLDKPIGTDGMSRLVALLRAEALAKLLDEGAKYISIRVLAAGGSTRTVQSLAWWVNRIMHSGGAIACFFLMDRAGTVECSRSFYSYSAYRPDPKHGTAMPKNNFGRK